VVAKKMRVYEMEYESARQVGVVVLRPPPAMREAFSATSSSTASPRASLYYVTPVQSAGQ